MNLFIIYKNNKVMSYENRMQYKLDRKIFIPCGYTIEKTFALLRNIIVAAVPGISRAEKKFSKPRRIYHRPLTQPFSILFFSNVTI